MAAKKAPKPAETEAPAKETAVTEAETDTPLPCIAVQPLHLDNQRYAVGEHVPIESLALRASLLAKNIITEVVAA